MSHVNVAMRVRPTAVSTGEYITLVPPGTMVINKPGSNDMYQFGYTFAAQDITNEQIYEQVGKPVVESVLEGYNGTILAYGQTGSGKTWTMLGPAGPLATMPAELKGVMPRSLDALFKALRNDRAVLEWKMSISYVEVYCEVIRDLLTAKDTAREGRGTAGFGQHDKSADKVDVVDTKGVMHLKGVVPTAVRDMKDVDTLVERAQAVRAQAATNMNERSSRSHTILTVWLETTRTDGRVHSKLNLVDLAGSERRKAVGEGDAETSREGDAINKSLLTLQNVVMALGTKGAVPSFRSSKLTHFLKDSIGGNCKTTLCACAWGDPQKVGETLATCRFAEKMMKVVVNATKNKGGLSTVHGNKVKLDPTVLAIMEKRVADGIAAARAELLAQYGAGGGGGGGGGGMSDAEKAELEALRQRVAGLDTAPQVGHASSAVEAEMEKLRLQLQEAERKARSLEAAQNSATLAGEGAEAAAAPPLAPGLDEAVTAFKKLCDLNPKQQALQQQLERGALSDDGREELDFLADEIDRLVEILERHGFPVPGVGAAGDGRLLAQRTVDAALYGGGEDLADELLSDDELSPESTPRDGQPMASSPPRPPRHNGPAARSGPGNLQLGSDPSMYPSASVAQGCSMAEMMSVPHSLGGQDRGKGHRKGMFGRDKGDTASPLSDDNLMAHNHLQSASKAQAAQDMVFIAPADASHVDAVLEDHSRVDTNLPFELEKMPQMPRGRGT